MLTPIFLGSLQGGDRPGDDLEPILRQLVDEVWPGLDLPAEAFLQHLAARWCGEPLVPWLRATHAADLHLACACALGLPGALEAFEAHFVPILTGYLNASRIAADDVIQSLREKLFVGERRIAAYSGRGSLLNWLRVVTLRIAIDVSRQKGEVIADGTLGSSRQPAAREDPELDYIKEHYRDAFKQAFHDALGKLDPELKTMLRLHYVDGATLEQVSAALGVGRSTVVRGIAEARESILEGARRLLSERVEIAQVEFDSLLQLLRSRLDLSLARLLRPQQ